MSRNGSQDGDGRREEDNINSYFTVGAVTAGVAALAGGLYWYTRGSQPTENTAQSLERGRELNIKESLEPRERHDSTSGYLMDMLNRISTSSSNSTGDNMPNSLSNFRQQSPPRHPVLSNLNALLSDIYVRYVQIKDSDFQLHYRVFNKVFLQLHQKMKDVDPYYRKYSSTVQFAGSHFDNLRIKKPDEFDMDIVIGLPLNLRAQENPKDSDIIIEPKAAGFVQLRMGVQFQKLPMRDRDEWQINKAAFEWMDSSNYLLRSKFTDWFKSVVNKALNTFESNGYQHLYYVDGVPYCIRKSESGPAMTLIMENKAKGFQLDVDLVPALKFPESRWPIGPNYRAIPSPCARGEWMVVGKPIKNGIPHDQSRSWRIALHNQERMFLHNTGNLRQALRLIKKLRDSLGLKKIASYYVKTLFFWEIVEKNDLAFWKRNNPAYLFKYMVEKFHAALVYKKIPYFWNKANNLIGGVDDRTLFEYAAKLVPVMQAMENSQDYKQVAKYLLTPEEFREYNARFLHI